MFPTLRNRGDRRRGPGRLSSAAGKHVRRSHSRLASFEALEDRRLLSVGAGMSTLTNTVARAPVAMAVDDTYVYWLEPPGAVGGPTGAIKAVDKVNGVVHELMTLDAGRGSQWDMTLDSLYVYYVDGYGLYRVAKTAINGSGPEETISTEFGLVKPPFGSRYGQNPETLAIDPAYSTIYVGNYDGVNGSVQMVNKMGGPVTTLAEVSYPIALATDNAFVHWVEPSNLRIRNAPLAGGAVSSDVPYTSYQVRTLKTDMAGSLFYARTDGFVGGVVGGSLVAYANNWSGDGLAVDPLGGNIYYGANDASIRYVPKTTLPVQTQLVTFMLTEDVQMVTDRNFLYWSEFWSSSGTINKIPKPAVGNLPNNWPNLDAIANQVGRVGLPLGFYAHATDIESGTPSGAAFQPLAASSLQYSLEAGAPAGASIDPSTGWFSWTPSSGQAGNHSITVRVVDSGSPPLDDRQTFTVNVAPVNIDSCGIYDPTQSQFYLRYLNSEGPVNSQFGFGAPGWKPLAGDWDGDGRDTIGLFQAEAAHFYLRNSNSSGLADVSFGYGDPSQGAQYVLIMGDWNGDGVDTVGLYHKASAAWFLRNTNTEGIADVTFGFGIPGSAWTPVVGDWNGDGIDTIGLYDPATGMFYLRNSHTTGIADIAFPYGSIGSGWTPLIGDWDGNGQQSAGFYQPGAASHFYLRNDFTAGIADVHFGLGFAGVQPIVGNWLGPTGQPLLAAGSSQPSGVSSQALIPNPQSLAPLLSEATARWAAAGYAISAPANVVVTDLPGAELGRAQEGVIYLDLDAAGHGWFIDLTPGDDREFAAVGGQLTAVNAAALDRIDLLTVVQHELGHLAGLDDLDASTANLMSGALGVGLRRNVR